jgi:Redoxin
MNQKNLLEVDWSKIPAPTDDGAAAHLKGMVIPPISLVATDDTSVTLSALPGRTVVFAYPRTGEPGKIALVDDWDMIPGARGCTPQTCAFRDLFAELKAELRMCSACRRRITPTRRRWRRGCICRFRCCRMRSSR